MRFPLAPSLVSMIWVAATSCGGRPAAAQDHRDLVIDADERPVWSGQVLERVDSATYTYLRVSVPGAEPRWVAIEADAPELGDEVEVRSLARRSHVWDPTVAREFEVLEYGALLSPAVGPRPGRGAVRASPGWR